MPAYNFKKQFAQRVQDGKKRQTIRFPRKRPTRPGDTLHLYTGMRTKQCRRLLPPQTCKDVQPILLTSLGATLGGVPLAVDQADKLAQADGFDNYGELLSFMRQAYPGVMLEMEVIYW